MDITRGMGHVNRPITCSDLTISLRGLIEAMFIGQVTEKWAGVREGGRKTSEKRGEQDRGPIGIRDKGLGWAA